MRANFLDVVYRGSHVMGPTHNHLELRFSNDINADYSVHILPPVGGFCHRADLKAGKVKAWIEEGLRLAEVEMGEQFQIEYAEAIANNNRRPDVYRELTRRIAHKFHALQQGEKKFG